MPKTVYEKMGMKIDDSVIYLNSTDEAIASIGFLGSNVYESLTQPFDHIVLFVVTQEDMKRQFQSLKQYLKPSGKLWVAWPKARQLHSDLSVPTVIKIGYDNGLVESTNLSINSVWTALKFTWPKPGKTYANSYGVLPVDRR